MRVRLKRFLALLLAAAILASFCSVTVFAGEVAKGTNGKTIYLGWTFYTDINVSQPVSGTLDANTEYYARLGFYGNPVSEGVTNTICSFSLYGTFDTNKIEIEQGSASIIKGDIGISKTIKGNEFNIQGASDTGITDTNEQLLENGCLARIKFKTKIAVASEDLQTLFNVTATLSSGEETNMGDGVKKLFTIVELPHLAVTVNEGAEFYDTSTPDEIKAGLSVSYIDPTGYSAPLAGEDVIVTPPTGGLKVGENTITVTGNGHTSEVTINVVEDEVLRIRVANDPTTMEYTSGQTLKLDGIVVKAVHKSGKETDINVADLFTRPANGAKLKTTDGGEQISIMYGSMPGNTAQNLIVSPADISDATIAAIEPQEYTGSQIKPALTVTYGTDNTPLVEGTDYTVTYGNNTTVAEGGSVTINGIGEYMSSKTVNFTITKATSSLTLKVNNSTEPQSIKYRNTITFTDGNGLTLGVYSDAETKVQFKPFTAEDTAYEPFSYANHSALPVGDYSFRAVRAESENVGPATSNVVKVTITPKPITEVDIEIDPQTYTGSAIEPDIKATIGMITLVKDKDYTLGDYKFNLNATTESQLASVKVTGTNNYDGETTVNFKINPQPLGDISEKFASVDTTDKEYTGSPYTPAVPDQVTIDQDTTLDKNTDYTVEYTNNTNAGMAKIIIKSKPGSNYTFTDVEKTFTINPVQIKINSSHYDWVPYVDGDKIKGYDSDGGGQKSPYFDYDGKEHGIKLQFKDTALANNGIKLETLVRITYTSETTRTNAGGYATQMKFELKEDCKTNYQLLNGNDEVVQERPLSKTWSIHKATLQVTAPDLNILCSELVKDEKKNYDYSLSWLGEGIKPIPAEVRTTNQGSFSNTSTTYDPTANVITFREVTAKAAGTTGDSFDLTLKFDNYNDLNVTVNVNYINKKPVNPTMAKLETTYGEKYALVVMLGDKDVTTNCTFTYNGSTEKPTNAGTYTVVATYSDNVEEDGYPGHTGTATATLTISQRPLTAKVTYPAITYGDAVDVTDANVCKVEFGNLVTGESLTMGTDFTVRTNYKAGDNVEGDYGFFITLDENSAVAKNYTVPTVTGTLTVNPKSLTAAMVEDVTAGLTYNGNEQTPTVTVKDGEKTLTSGTDYTLTYKNNTNAGTATVTVEGKGNYTGKVEKTFKIEKANPTITLVRAASVDYTGAQYSNKNVEVTKPSDIEVTYEYYLQNDTACTTPVKPIDAGSYKVRISFAGNDNYNAVQPTATVDFTINKVNHPISITAASVTYTGAVYSEKNITVTPTCEVTFTYYASETGNESITRPTDVGKYWVVASYAGTDNYNSSTSARVSFSITKATPPTPPEIKVDNTDTTLGELGNKMLVEIDVPGTIHWYGPDGKPITDPHTKIEANTEYSWEFVPADGYKNNYNGIGGKTTPYVRDDLSWLPGVLGGGSTFNFRDVTRYDYFYNAVKWAAENGIASGTSRYTFSPDAVCTRAQTVTFLWRAAGSPMPSYRISPFTDVNYGDYYYNAVLWAVEQGITTGLTATTFGPDKTVTRGQVAMFLYRAASAVKPNITNSFTDVKSTAYNYDAILWAYDNRITTGTSTTTFSPDAFCTRAQIVTFLYRFYQGR